MPKIINRLSPRSIHNLKEGLHSDGGNLYLKVRATGSRAWVFRYREMGQTHEIGLGSINSRSLKQARDLGQVMRELVEDGKDPREAVPKKKNKKDSITFSSLAEDYIETKSVEWKNLKHHQQWRNTLRDYAYPVIGNLHPSEIKLDHILKVLRPIWTTKVETAKRVQGRIEQILDAAYVLGHRTEQNPAKLKGVLDKVLPNSNKIRVVRHHPSLPYSEAPHLLQKLAKKSTISSLCLQFLMLTCVRSFEARGAHWDEINFEQRLWKIPGDRIKMAKEHRVPLSDEAIKLIESCPMISGCGFIFPNSKGHPLTDVAISKVLKEFHPDVTVHGMRSTFRVWAAEQTDYPREICELALAHGNLDRVEAAYQRSDLLEKRRDLMEEWGAYLL